MKPLHSFISMIAGEVPEGDVGDCAVASQDVLQCVQGAVHVNLCVRILGYKHPYLVNSPEAEFLGEKMACLYEGRFPSSNEDAHLYTDT